MKRFLSVILCLAALIPQCSCGAAPASQSLLIEAEAFQFAGSWTMQSHPGTLGRKCLLSGDTGMDAMTVVNVPEAGAYHVWVRSLDFPNDRPGTRLGQLSIDSTPTGPQFGKNGHADWFWENDGVTTLTAGQHVLSLIPETGYARCDAILLTTGAADPNSASLRSLKADHVNPDKIVPISDAGPQSIQQPVALGAGAAHEVARIGGASTQVVFLSTLDANGAPRIITQYYLRSGGALTRVPLDPDGGRLYLLHDANAKLAIAHIPFEWPDSPASRVHFVVGGKTYHTSLTSSDPFLAANTDLFEPFAAKQIDVHTVDVSYKTANGQTADVRWMLPADADDARVSVKYSAPTAGYDSVIFEPFAQLADSDVKADLLAPLFQSRRRPAVPEMLINTYTPHPVVLVQTSVAGAPLTLGIAAEPKDLPFVWPSVADALYGFSLTNASSGWQPTVFAPVLGNDNSKMAAGESKSVDFRVLMIPGDWETALAYSSDKIDDVTDYRKPYGVSLTTAGLNMIDLLKDDNACGWSPQLKGFWNIESQDTVAQSAPLAVVSAAMVSHDESLYVTKALPTIEFMLSRPGVHFAPHLVSTSQYIRPESIKIAVPSQAYDTSEWDGLYALLGETDPWIKAIADSQNGLAKSVNSNGRIPQWTELLAQYRIDPTPALLQEIKTEADTWIKTAIDTPSTEDLGTDPFYNVSYYPYWWDLPDLYDATHDSRYIKAAASGAYGTLAGLWSEPQIPSGDTTVNPTGEFEGVQTIWWKGDVRYRLGVPRKPGDTPAHKVPNWLVSDVGLGLEQPVTYYAGGGGFHHIMNSAWAPNLLRMYQLTGDDIYRTYARNTIISRFGNYPGYYLTGFTDIELSPDYPYKGPDVTSDYYHHIPVQLGFTLDYVVTEASVRSTGKIHFPWSREQGYVWFTYRVYGGAPGTIFGDDNASLLLDPKLAHVDSPAIDYLTARSNGKFWVVLMNESDTAQPANIQLDRAALGIADGAAETLVTSDGKATPYSGGSTVTVPAKGLVAVAFAAKPTDVYAAVPKLAGGRAQTTVGGDWGDAQAFRIRSPFGKDALYVVMTGHPKDGSTATLSIDGGASQTVSQYPYEFTVYPWAMNKDMHFSLSLNEPGAAAQQTKPLDLPGTGEVH